MSEDGKRRTKKLWIKQSKAPELTFAELSKSYANLRKAGLDRTVPEPIGHDSVNEIVITSFVEGKSLFPIAIAAALSNPFGFNSEVSEIFRKIGQWLATYHNNAQCAEKTSVASIAENCLAEINHNESVDQHNLAEVRRNLELLAADNELQELQSSVYSHNDFALRNILVANRPIQFYVIDWDSFLDRKFRRRNVRWWDAFYFWFNVKSLKRFSPILSSSRVDNLATEFIRGYLELTSNPPPMSIVTERVFYVMLSAFMLGQGGTRTLAEVYSKRSFGRFMHTLHRYWVTPLTHGNNQLRKR
jgi:hypothetical protein